MPPSSREAHCSPGTPPSGFWQQPRPRGGAGGSSPALFTHAGSLVGVGQPQEPPPAPPSGSEPPCIAGWGGGGGAVRPDCALPTPPNPPIPPPTHQGASVTPNEQETPPPPPKSPQGWWLGTGQLPPPRVGGQHRRRTPSPSTLREPNTLRPEQRQAGICPPPHPSRGLCVWGGWECSHSPPTPLHHHPPPGRSSLHSRALLSAKLLRLLEMSRRRKRQTTLASTLPLAVLGGNRKVRRGQRKSPGNRGVGGAPLSPGHCTALPAPTEEAAPHLVELLNAADEVGVAGGVLKIDIICRKKGGAVREGSPTAAPLSSSSK